MADLSTTDQDRPAEPDTPAEPPAETDSRPGKFNLKQDWRRIRQWYVEHKKWAIPATVIVIAAILAGVPYTRYGLAGLALKRDISVKVLDATAGTPVSGATVTVGSVSAETNGSGIALLPKIKDGHHQATISKKYYRSRTADILAPILSQKNIPAIDLTATGRQVMISVSDLITRKPLAGVSITLADTTAKTDTTGTAIAVLPVGISQQSAKLSLSGYNDASVTVKVSNNIIQNNQFSLTPAGKVYFLSNLTGKLDVVKTDLDGTERQTVLPGTGNEDNQNTVLLASRDWKYLALLSRRAGNYASLYLISTANDSLTTIDSGNLNFDLSGWVGDDFVYTVTNNDVQLWQPGHQAIKSYNAVAKKTVILDQTAASGSDSYTYTSQLVGNVYGYDDQIYYIMNWTAGINSMAQLTSQQATFNSVKPDGSAKKAIRSFGLASGAQATDINVDDRVENPTTIALYFYDGSQDNFYTYANGQVKSDSGQTSSNYFTANYPTYLQSPSGSQTFWSEPRDGKNTLFVGDQAGQSSRQIASLSDYSPYGWYTDDYLLVSKNGSELYIMPPGGSSAPIKISDYYKPVVTYPGYGGGYGGI